MGRYDLPDPKCNHKRKGRVTAGSYEGAHASYSVCDRWECIADAKEWAIAITGGLDPVYIPDRSKEVSEGA